MTKISTKHFLMVLCVMVNALAIQAQFFKMECHPNLMPEQPSMAYQSKNPLDKAECYQVNTNGRKAFYAKQDNASAVEQEDQFTVTINLEGLNDEDYPMPYFYIQVCIINSQFNRNVQFMMSTTEQTTVPAGQYDIICNFPYQTLLPRWVILEHVDINSDMNITLNPDMATRRISFKDYMPNGEVLRLDMGHTDEETGQWVVTQKGNVVFADVVNRMYNKEYGIISDGSIGYAGYNLDEEMATCADADFFVSEVSDRFVFTQDRIAADADINWYVTHFSTDNCNIGTVENSAEDYVCNETMFDFSPYGMAHQGYGYSLDHLFIDNQGCLNGGGRPQVSINLEHDKSLIHRTFVNYPGCYDPLTQETSVYLPMIFEMSSQENSRYDAYPLQGSAFMVGDNSEILNVGIGHPLTGHGLTNFAWSTHNGNNIVTKIFPPHPAFTYNSNRQKNHFGSSCPINDVIRNNCYYIGQYGEVRFSDNLTLDTTIYYNGNIVEQLPEDNGVCEVIYTNTNIEVEGLDGNNITTIHYDTSLEDITPPTLRMLHFKDGDNDITNCFETSSDGTMEFAAGDYHWIPDGWYGEFDCQPVDVMVEYAPYGTEDWSEIAVEEVPELYQMPGWGYFYRGSLAGVTGQAEKGWFDIKFRLVDEAGNWQEQVVSPAFRIDDLAYSSVATVGSGNAHEVARYNLAGQRVDASHQGVTIIKMSDGTARKVIN